ncbi:MAG: YbjQ family protein [Alphaproteobacteria bacterium]
MTELLLILIVLVATYLVGVRKERQHYHIIRVREKNTAYLPISNEPEIADMNSIKHTELVAASVVIGSDFFKHVWASLRNIFGGSITAYESLLDRAKREAILRLKESSLDCDGILNVRFATLNISARMVEVTAYGTKVYMKSHA